MGNKIQPMSLNLYKNRLKAETEKPNNKSRNDQNVLAMKKKLVIVCICLLGCLFLSAQERRQGSIIENISRLKEANVQFEKIHFFEETSNARLSRQVQKDVKAFKLLNVSASALEQIHKTEERFFAVSVPLPDGSFAQLNLIESSHLIGDYTVRTSSGKQYTSIRNTITFLRGEVEHNGVKVVRLGP